jgi:hypothetical protein
MASVQLAPKKSFSVPPPNVLKFEMATVIGKEPKQFIEIRKKLKMKIFCKMYFIGRIVI